MGLLQKATNQQAYGKVGFFGFQGSGKSFTAAEIAIGIVQMTGDKRPIGWFDTETGSDFLLPRIRAAGSELLVVKSRAFTDLCNTIKEAEKECSVLIIDSITHVWRELCDAYKTKLKRTRLQFQDWDAVKKEWQEYTDLFVNSKLHIMVCGRAGYDYDYDFNEDGTKDLVKTGTKMKAEGEFGFEPSLVIEMERVTQGQEDLEELRGKGARQDKRQAYKPKIGSEWTHRAHVLKDRTDTINGGQFDNPNFEPFRPHFLALNLGGEHLGVDTSRNSGDLFHPENGGAWKQQQTRKQIALDVIQACMTELWPGQSAIEKKLKQLLVRVAFSTRSWTDVENRSMEYLEQHARFFEAFVERYPSEVSGSDLTPEEVAEGLWAVIIAEYTQETIVGIDMPEVTESPTASTSSTGSA